MEELHHKNFSIIIIRYTKQMRNEKVIQDEIRVPLSWTDKYAESLFQGCRLFGNKREVNPKRSGHPHATRLPCVPRKSDDAELKRERFIVTELIRCITLNNALKAFRLVVVYTKQKYT